MTNIITNNCKTTKLPLFIISALAIVFQIYEISDTAAVEGTSSNFDIYNSIILNSTLGEPIFIEHYKVNNNENDTQEIENINDNQSLVEPFTGNGTLLGLEGVIASGNSISTALGNSTFLIEGNAELTFKDANNITSSAPYTFKAIGNPEQDGGFSSRGAAFFESNATGDLSFLSNMVGIYKNQSDRNGNGIFLMWKWE